MFARPIESLPQEIYDEISHYLSTGDARNVCLASRALNRGFAQRKWRNIALRNYPTTLYPGRLYLESQITALFNLWVAMQRDTDTRMAGTPFAVTQARIPYSEYIRQADYEKAFSYSGSRREYQFEDVAPALIQTISAMPKLQYLELGTCHQTDSPMYEEALKSARKWPSIRMLRLTTDFTISTCTNANNLVSQILKSHLPNLEGLRLAFWPWDDLGVYQTAVAHHRNLKKLHLEPMSSSQMMDDAIIDRLSSDFKHLEWLTIDCSAEPYRQLNLIPDFPLAFHLRASLFILAIQRLTKLRRLAIGHRIYRPTPDWRYQAYHRFAINLFNQVKSLEKFCVLMDGGKYMKYERGGRTSLNDCNPTRSIDAWPEL